MSFRKVDEWDSLPYVGLGAVLDSGVESNTTLFTLRGFGCSVAQMLVQAHWRRLASDWTALC